MAQEYALPGLRVVVGAPSVVAEGVGHYWFPGIARFAAGPLIIGCSIVADSTNNAVSAEGVHISDDDGETWPLRYDVGTGVMIPIAQPDGAIAGPAFRIYRVPHDPPGMFRTHSSRFEADGRRHVFEPWDATIEGFPRDVDVEPIPARPDLPWLANLAPHGSAIAVDGGVLTTAYLRYEGDARSTVTAIVSNDGGRSWRYRSTVAGPDAAPRAPEGEGPSEAAMIRLADGDLMCVMRVGHKEDHPLLRAYSHDDGASWSAPDVIPAFSVDPSLVRTSNDVIALAAGRPGLDLWFSTDPRAQTWHNLDVIAHHNAHAPGPEHAIVATRKDGHAVHQTTAYTGMIEVAPGKLLLVYDRTPFGWKPVPVDSPERSRIYVLPIAVERQ